MILLMDTSSEVSQFIFIDDDWKQDNEWRADRGLAKDLLKYLSDRLSDIDRSWSDVSAIGVFEGPGSFTGLRIGITVANTIADSYHIPIVGARGDDWRIHAISKIESGSDEKIVLPFYGRQANISTPKK